MKDLRTFALWMLVVSLAGVTKANELFVPADYASIQAALNNLLEGDTVTVSLGTYPEELITPPLSFVLRGDVIPDTGDYPRPIVDPSSLQSPESRACMHVSGGAPIIENFRFRNGPEMFPRSLMGGVHIFSGNSVFRDCVFDSTYVGLGDFSPGAARIWLERCNFISNVWACVRLLGGRITATDCLFSGQGFEMVRATDSSRFINCRFRDDTTGHLLNLHGPGQWIEGCVFGPYGPFAFSAITGNDFGGKFLNCLFTDIQPGANVMGIARDCAEPFEVSHCRFTGISGQAGTAGVGFGCSENAPGQQATVADNIFDNFFASEHSTGKCIRVGPSGADIRRNRFAMVFPPEAATISCQGTANVLRDNLFFNTGYALAVCASGCFADARWNWWGDSTGPYHPMFNPNGQGDQVSDNVEFNPWYTDTLFIQDAIGERRELPQGFSLAAYPNPFNAQTRLRFTAGAAAIITLELFDILGRRVREIWSGPVLGEHMISFDAADLPSGIYFARAFDVTYNRPLISTKLMLLK